jgi:hypothetical protein
MFAVVIRESGDATEIDRGGPYVAREVAPRVRQAPGFVSAMWMSDGAGGTLNVLAFDSEEAARGALERARRSARPDSMNLESADVYRVLATTERPANGFRGHVGGADQAPAAGRSHDRPSAVRPEVNGGLPSGMAPP